MTNNPDTLTQQDLQAILVWLQEGYKTCPTSQLRDHTLIAIHKVISQLGAY